MTLHTLINLRGGSAKAYLHTIPTSTPAYHTPPTRGVQERGRVNFLQDFLGDGREHHGLLRSRPLRGRVNFLELGLLTTESEV